MISAGRRCGSIYRYCETVVLIKYVTLLVDVEDRNIKIIYRVKETPDEQSKEVNKIYVDLGNFTRTSHDSDNLLSNRNIFVSMAVFAALLAVLFSCLLAIGMIAGYCVLNKKKPVSQIDKSTGRKLEQK